MGTMTMSRNTMLPRGVGPEPTRGSQVTRDSYPKRVVRTFMRPKYSRVQLTTSEQIEQYEQMSPEEKDAENQRVWKLRSKRLVGRTIIGTLTSTTSAKGRTFHWINWSKSTRVLIRRDTVKVSKPALEDIGNPKVGTTLKCVISGLGPDLSVCKSAWCAHPTTTEVEQVDPSAVDKLVSEFRRAKAEKICAKRSRFFSSPRMHRCRRWSTPRRFTYRSRSDSPSWRTRAASAPLAVMRSLSCSDTP